MTGFDGRPLRKKSDDELDDEMLDTTEEIGGQALTAVCARYDDYGQANVAVALGADAVICIEIVLGQEANLSIVIDNGDQSRMIPKALVRKQCAAWVGGGPAA